MPTVPGPTTKYPMSTTSAYSLLTNQIWTGKPLMSASLSMMSCASSSKRAHVGIGWTSSIWSVKINASRTPMKRFWMPLLVTRPAIRAGARNAILGGSGMSMARVCMSICGSWGGRFWKPYKAVTAGEMPRISDVDEIIKTMSQKDGELKMMYIFDVVNLDTLPGQGRMALRDWEVRGFREADWENGSLWWSSGMDGTLCSSITTTIQDRCRSFADDSDEWREKDAKLLALMQTTLSGTIIVYQGEKNGMRNMPKD